MPANAITGWIDNLLEDLQTSRQRRIVVLHGTPAWCDDELEALLDSRPDALLISDRYPAPRAIPFAKAEACLGSETSLLLLDLFDGFNPDVLCIAAGLVRSGGVLLLLAPPTAQWDIEVDRYACWQDEQRSARARFVEYFFAALTRAPEVGATLSADAVPTTLPALPQLQVTPLIDGMTPDQAALLARLEPWLQSRSSGIALLVAARGRGKSHCLGLLADRQQAPGKVLVTARSRQAAKLLLEQAPRAEFFAPDRLLHEAPPARLLLVDEAAAIPLSLLRRLIRRYPLAVVATTSGGYEGTGRGFLLRFANDLREVPDTLDLKLVDPVRWCRGDRLEEWLDRPLIPDSDGESTDLPVTVENCEFRLLEQASEADEQLLIETYRLLVSAHYRTRPSDLRMLMENPDLGLVIALHGQRVIGALLLNREGGFDSELCAAVFLGHRRPRGHLLAQMLTSQAGMREFATLRGLRVLRIAVAEASRRRGIGARLIDRALQYARDRSFAWLGASFALDPLSAGFWRRSGFRLVHIGFARGKSSGEHSVAVLRPCDDSAKRSTARMQRRIGEQLPVWLTQFLQDMDSMQVTALLRLADFDTAIGELERDDIEAFASGNRGFELCFASLQKYVMKRIAQGDISPARLLVEKAVQNRAWEHIEREAGDEGRRQLLRRLRGLVEALGKPC